MNNENKNLWDVRLGIVAPILTLIGILVGLYTFQEGQRRNTLLEMKLLNCRDETEFQRQLWLKKSEVYAKLLDIVGEIVAIDKGKNLPASLRKQFMAIYWGNTLLVEDKEVETVMRRFRIEMDHFRDDWSNSVELKRRAYNLGNILRESLDKTRKARYISTVCFLNSESQVSP